MPASRGRVGIYPDSILLKTRSPFTVISKAPVVSRDPRIWDAIKKLPKQNYRALSFITDSKTGMGVFKAWHIWLPNIEAPMMKNCRPVTILAFVCLSSAGLKFVPVTMSVS